MNPRVEDSRLLPASPDESANVDLKLPMREGHAEVKIIEPGSSFADVVNKRVNVGENSPNRRGQTSLIRASTSLDNDSTIIYI